MKFNVTRSALVVFTWQLAVSYCLEAVEDFLSIKLYRQLGWPDERFISIPHCLQIVPTGERLVAFIIEDRYFEERIGKSRKSFASLGGAISTFSQTCALFHKPLVYTRNLKGRINVNQQKLNN